MAYLVKSINLNNCDEHVVLNVRLFRTHSDADRCMRILEQKIPKDCDSQWLEIEELDYE
jgi:hypothetical protein